VGANAFENGNEQPSKTKQKYENCWKSYKKYKRSKANKKEIIKKNQKTPN